MNDEEVSYVLVCTEHDVTDEPTTGKPDDDPVKKRETRVCTVHRTALDTETGEVPTIERSSVGQAKDTNGRGNTTEVRMSRLKCHVLRI